MPANPHIDRSDLGLTLASLTDDARARLGMAAHEAGVLVEGVVTNSTAWERGIIPGSVIVMVDRQPVSSQENVLQAIEAAKRGNQSSVLLLIVGTHGLHWIPLPLRPVL
jgi:S1-C subfamily serine protease